MADIVEKRYIVLAGGFWGASKELLAGRQVDYNNDSVRMSDYIISVEGLPPDMFVPESIRRHKTHWCKLCKRPVQESEIENKWGCAIDHVAHIEFKEKTIEQWRTDVFESYYQPKQRWMKPCWRIWVNNEQGKEKFREIWRYIESHYPSNKLVPIPKFIGTRRDWLIEREEVPVIKLDIPEELRETVIETKTLHCHACNYVAKNTRALQMHMTMKHHDRDEKKAKPVEQPTEQPTEQSIEEPTVV